MCIHSNYRTTCSSLLQTMHAVRLFKDWSSHGSSFLMQSPHWSVVRRSVWCWCLNSNPRTNIRRLLVRRPLYILCRSVRSRFHWGTSCWNSRRIISGGWQLSTTEVIVAVLSGIRRISSASQLFPSIVHTWTVMMASVIARQWRANVMLDIVASFGQNQDYPKEQPLKLLLVLLRCWLSYW